MVYLLVQVWPLITSPLCVTTTPGQLSLAVTDAIFGVGTANAQLTVTGAGQTIVGGVVEITFIVSTILLHNPSCSACKVNVLLPAPHGVGIIKTESLTI